MRGDTEKLRASLNNLWEIYQEIGDTANQVSTWRCPYKNMYDRCTAKFGCRYQKKTGRIDDLPVCTGSDNLDYRNAWET